AAKPNRASRLGPLCSHHQPLLPADPRTTPNALPPLRRHHPREEPGALAAHAGICAGGGAQSSSLPRPSGYLFPQASCSKLGIDRAKHFGKVVFSGGHEQGVIGVLNKTYDAAVTWTNDIEKHTRGGLQMLLARDVLKKEDIRIIWVSDLIPNPVI